MRQACYNFLDNNVAKTTMVLMGYASSISLAAQRTQEEDERNPFITGAAIAGYVLSFGGRMALYFLKPASPEESVDETMLCLTRSQDTSRAVREVCSPTTLALITAGAASGVIGTFAAFTITAAIAEEEFKKRVLEEEQRQLKLEIERKYDRTLVFEIEKMFDENKKCQQYPLNASIAGTIGGGISTFVNIGVNGFSKELGVSAAVTATSISFGYTAKGIMLQKQNKALQAVMDFSESTINHLPPSDKRDKLVERAQEILESGMETGEIIKRGTVGVRFPCGATAGALGSLAKGDVDKNIAPIFAILTFSFMTTEMLIDFIREAQKPRLPIEQAEVITTTDIRVIPKRHTRRPSNLKNLESTNEGKGSDTTSPRPDSAFPLVDANRASSASPPADFTQHNVTNIELIVHQHGREAESPSPPRIPNVTEDPEDVGTPLMSPSASPAKSKGSRGKEEDLEKGPDGFSLE